MKFTLTIFVFGFALTAHSQSAFQNLNFESANLGSIPPGQTGFYVAVTAALPGWSASIAGASVTQVLQNNYDLGSPSVDILGPDWNSVAPGIIGGNYTVFLQAGVNPQDLSPVDASIWQNGTIPAGEQSLQFKAWNFLPPYSSFSISFAGNVLNPVVLSSSQTAQGQPYTLYGVNIAPYAGQSGNLEFTAVGDLNGPSWVEFDDIAFSTTVVPEPNVIMLSAFAGLLIWVRKSMMRH